MQTVLSNNPNTPKGILDGILNANSTAQAISVAGPFLSDPMAKALQQANLANTIATTAKTKADTAKLYSDMNTTGTGNKILTPSEASTLGVPYGTTNAQAIGANPADAKVV